MSELRVCRLCEIRERLTGNISEYVNRYLEEIREEDRASEKCYVSRLEICASCNRCHEAMCTACGCYVEFRAAVKDRDCPYHRWKKVF